MKLLALPLLLFGLTAFKTAFACRCTFVKSEEVQNNPSLAKSALTFHHEIRGDNPIFRVDSAWTTYEPTLPMDPYASCAHKILIDQSYLLLSTEKIEDILKNKGTFTRCNSLVVELGKAGPLIEKLALKTSTNPSETNPSWHFCQNNEDCNLSSAPCGGLEGVNKRYLASYEEWRNKVAPSLQCMGPKGQPPQKVSCIANRCTPG